MLQGVMSLSELRVRDVMIPRSQMVVLDAKASVADNVRIILEAQHSRYPVIAETRDQLAGLLMAKDLLTAYLKNPQKPIDDLSPFYRPVFYVPEGKRATELLREFQSRHLHLAVVVDEYGSLAGLVTIEDIIEGIVGEIEDEYDETDVHIIEINPNTFTVKALTPVYEFNQFFHCHLDQEIADTIGGLVVATLGRVPQTGDSIVVANCFEFKVLRSDRRRVHLFKVSRLVTPLLPPPDSV
jgi:magnesium and cobalt transporter